MMQVQLQKKFEDYRTAIWEGYNLVKEKQMINTNIIVRIQEKLEHNQAGIRSTLGTVIKNTATDEIIYTPQQEKSEILEYMKNLEEYINNDADMVDPLIKLAMIHYQFEATHPFYDGNGRIINIIYLVLKDLIDTPILYLSKYIIRNKLEYYRLFQETRNTNGFEEWIIYMLTGIEEMAEETLL